MVKTDENGNVRPVKPKHGSAKKIDGIVAMIMSLGLAQGHEETAVSIFDTEWEF